MPVLRAVAQNWPEKATAGTPDRAAGLPAYLRPRRPETASDGQLGAFSGLKFLAIISKRYRAADAPGLSLFGLNLPSI